MKASPPLRFLALVAGGWICVRAALLAPGWRESAGPAVEADPGAVPAASAGSPRPMLRTVSRPVHFPVPARLSANGLAVEASPSYFLTPVGRALSPTPAMRPRPGRLAGGRDAAAPGNSFIPAAGGQVGEIHPGPGPAAPAAPAPPPRSSRWSGAAWVLVRDDRGAAALAPGGTLGGSQAGARLLYRIGGGLALSARAYLALRQPGGAEGAAGLDWQPAVRLPVHLLAERRQDAGGGGRSAFALSLYGGGSRRLAYGLRLDAYGQAGIVGTRSRDWFADGSVRISAPLGPIALGGGAWGGAQPGAARLDAGPSISWRLPVPAANLRLQGDWRFRVAGDAAPGSGPALILAADF